MSSLTPMDKELIGENDEQANEREADLVFKARFEGQETFFLIHVEPQARSEGAFPFRMLEYCLMLLKKYNQFFTRKSKK
jgi:hypothetical protein